jgi:hypothetical protein
MDGGATECVNTEVRIILYKDRLSNGDWDTSTAFDSGSQYGTVWSSPPYAGCDSTIIVPLPSNRDRLRFAMTSRLDGERRKISYETW